MFIIQEMIDNNKITTSDELYKENKNTPIQTSILNGILEKTFDRERYEEVRN